MRFKLIQDPSIIKNVFQEDKTMNIPLKKYHFVLFITLMALSVPTYAFDHTHKLWNDTLKKYVVLTQFSSAVKYKELKSNSSQFNQYLKILEGLKKSDFNKFNKKQKLSFLINAYNAFTVKLILDNYPLRSIKDLGGLFSSAWKKKFFTLFGKKSHLDNIEHDMIRKDFNEPRIHFAVVCASIGCPALKNEAYTHDKLLVQLEESSHKFLRDTSRNRFNKASQTLELSSIFKWYGKDFDKTYGSYLEFVAGRMNVDPATKKLIQSKKLKLTFLKYDWKLNSN
jgi:hypothetical protein